MGAAEVLGAAEVAGIGEAPAERATSPADAVPAAEYAPMDEEAFAASGPSAVEAAAPASAASPADGCPNGPEDAPSHEPVVTLGGPRTPAEGSRVGKPSKGSTQARRGRVALVACVGVLVIGGGLGVDRYLDDAADEPNVLQSIARGHLAGWLGRFDAMQRSDVVSVRPGDRRSVAICYCGWANVGRHNRWGAHARGRTDEDRCSGV